MGIARALMPAFCRTISKIKAGATETRQTLNKTSRRPATISSRVHYSDDISNHTEMTDRSLEKFRHVFLISDIALDDMNLLGVYTL